MPPLLSIDDLRSANRDFAGPFRLRVLHDGRVEEILCEHVLRFLPLKRLVCTVAWRNEAAIAKVFLSRWTPQAPATRKCATLRVPSTQASLSAARRKLPLGGSPTAGAPVRANYAGHGLRLRWKLPNQSAGWPCCNTAVQLFAPACTKRAFTSRTRMLEIFSCGETICGRSTAGPSGRPLQGARSSRGSVSRTWAISWPSCLPADDPLLTSLCGAYVRARGVPFLPGRGSTGGFRSQVAGAAGANHRRQDGPRLHRVLRLRRKRISRRLPSRLRLSRDARAPSPI